MASPALAELAGFVNAGPLYPKLRNVPAIAEWAQRGAQLVADITGDAILEDVAPSTLEHSVAVRVFHLYLPMYFWMRDLVRETVADRASKGDLDRRAVSIGLSAPQGCGKTTVVNYLSDMFAADGLVCASVSIDDFYLTGADQVSLAAAHPYNPILQVRGNAGTHDVALGVDVIEHLRSAHDGDVAVPVYDKAARSGKGDRAPETAWRYLQTPCDVILLEGWMTGFKHRGDAAALAAIHPSLPEIDAALLQYAALDDLLDAWCVIGLEDKSHVFEWRLEAERKMAASGRPGMTDDAVRDFVARYMPAYTAYCPALYAAAGSDGVDGKPTLLVHVDGNRRPVAPKEESESESEDSIAASDCTVGSTKSDGMLSQSPSRASTRAHSNDSLPGRSRSGAPSQEAVFSTRFCQSRFDPCEIESLRAVEENVKMADLMKMSVMEFSLLGLGQERFIMSAERDEAPLVSPSSSTLWNRRRWKETVTAENRSSPPCA